MIRFPVLAALLLIGPASATAAGPGDELLRLVPADAAGILVVENLRDQSSKIVDSPLFAAASRQPFVQDWLKSGRFRDLEQAGRDLEAATGVSLKDLRDEIVGDAVVLGYFPEAARAHGLLLVRPRRRDILSNLVNKIDRTPDGSGNPPALSRRVWREQGYGIREFKAAGKPTEYYAFLPDDVFALSNSEELIKKVIDRQVTRNSDLWEDASFQKARQGLPEPSLARAFLHPRLLAALFARPPAGGPPPEPLRRGPLAICRRRRLRGARPPTQGRPRPPHARGPLAGPPRPWARRWLSQTSKTGGLLAQVPESAIAVASADVNFEALRSAAWELISEDDRRRLETYRVGLKGILLGLDPVTQVWPRLGPGMLAYLEDKPERGSSSGSRSSASSPSRTSRRARRRPGDRQRDPDLHGDPCPQRRGELPNTSRSGTGRSASPSSPSWPTRRGPGSRSRSSPTGSFRQQPGRGRPIRHRPGRHRARRHP